MDSIANFKRKYGPKNKKNNSASYKMEDWFENMFQHPKTKKSSSPRKEKAVEVAAVRSKSSSPRSKSRSSKEKSPLKEIVAAVNLEELVVPTTRESKIRIINPLSPRTRKMRKEVSDAKLAEMLLKPPVKMASSNPLRLNMTRRPRGIDASVDIEDTTKFPLGRTMHNCSRLVDNCQSISQAHNRGSYSIIYNDRTEQVFPSFAQLVTFITDDYMTKNRGRIPYHQRPIQEARVINTLSENGITAAARGVKTRKNNKKRKGTKRKGRGKGKGNGKK
jgi:hypothetical protein